MNILLMIPDAGIHKISLGPFRMSFREAPLTLTTLAALTPDDANATLTLIDENVQSVPKTKRFDLVAISCLTGTAFKAYEWSRHFRSQGATVVLGGYHVTLRPEEAMKHADTVMTGFAELAWPQLVQDFKSGTLKPRYEGGQGDVNLLPPPRRDLQKRFGYAMPNAVSATRACKCHCAFCSIPAAKLRWQMRPLPEVIDEIRAMPGRRFTFNDVNLLQDRDYGLELLEALTPLNKLWGGLAMVSTANDPELLEALERSGCQYLLCGFESLSKTSLDSVNKRFNRVEDYGGAVEAFHDHGISVQGCFIFGLDDDLPDIFHQTVEAVNDMKVDIPRFAISTPYPGTELFQKLEQEGRLLHTHWPHYDTQHVVFQPTHMSPEELDRGFREAYRLAFSISAMKTRVKHSPHPGITAVGNLAYRRYLKRLAKDRTRIHTPGRT